jgi:cardiolipin synthase
MDLDFNRFVIEVLPSVRAIPWHWIVAIAHIAFATIALVHAMLYKRDPRAALGWISVCVLFPLLGPLLYYMFGINRIQTQARKVAPLHLLKLHIGHEQGATWGTPEIATRKLGPQIQRYVHVSDRVTSRPLIAGNKVEILHNGEQAYPAMLAAIDGAVKQVLLITYLFESDEVGNAFAAALSAARQRGVDVKVIVDGVGELYTWPRMRRKLHKAGIQVARFLPPKLLPPTFSVNLRNHRKILVVDGECGFTGGMNIGARHLVESASARRTADLHFRVQGPVVAQLKMIFREDWRFATGKAQDFISQQQSVAPSDASELIEYAATSDITNMQHGTTWCRCVSDGPNDDLDKISLVIMGAISAAQQSVTIITPYFLPSRELIATLQSAALRGVDVAVILPKQSNLRFVDWATRNLLWELLQRDVKIYYQPPPFDHTKLFIVDGVYAHVGSANLDPRSLRLNFELNLEIIGEESIAPMVEHARAIRLASAELTLQDVDERPFVFRIRDAACWLFMPYL